MKRFSVIRGGGRRSRRRRNALALGLATFFGVLVIGVATMVAPQADVAEARETAATIAQPPVIDGDTIEDLGTGERSRLANRRNS